MIAGDKAINYFSVLLRYHPASPLSVKSKQNCEISPPSGSRSVEKRMSMNGILRISVVFTPEIAQFQLGDFEFEPFLTTKMSPSPPC
jgi:hypothetical protein